jgi:hypothetical protein
VPSFDIVSEVDMHEINNALDQAVRELGTRFDLRGVDASIELNDETITISAPEEFQITQIEGILRDKLTSRKVDTRSLEAGEVEGAGKVKRKTYTLRQGIDRDTAKTITKMTKDSKLKVQAQINGDKLRVQGKKRDELQQLMTMLRDADLDTPLQFDNFRD